MAGETACAAKESAVEPVDLTADFYQAPDAVYDRLRSRGPVHFVRFPDSSTGWLVTDYEVAKLALTEPTISKVMKSARARSALAANSGDQPVQSGLFKDMMVFYDPPEHTRLRALVNRAFGGRAVRDLAPSVNQIAESLLAEMATAAHADQDLLEGYAVPLPMMVICALLGVPGPDRDKFQGWSTILVSSDHSGDARTTAVREFVAYIDQLIRAKAAAPDEDLLSELIAAGDDGDRLTHRELISMVFLLLVAGYETTVNLIGNAVATLLGDHDLRVMLRDDLSRVPSFVEEVLRYRSPAGEATFRHTTTPITLGGIEIPAGELIVVSMAAAGRDPVRFPDPHRVDIARTDNHHIAFGYGIHRCVGAQLARTEATIALTRLLGEYPDLELAAGARLEWRRSLIVRGLTELPVRLRP